MDRLEKIKWLVNNPNPCIKCGMSSSCCGCPKYYEWKPKFDIDDSITQETNNVREALCLKKDLEKCMSNISEEVKKAFML